MHRQYLLLLLLTLFASANHISWYGNYNKAFQSARKENKPLLVLVVKKDSLLCSTIIRHELMNAPYVDELNKKVVSVIVTYEGSASYPIEMFYTTIFPTLFFVDSQRELFLREPLYGSEISVKSISEIIKTL